METYISIVLLGSCMSSNRFCKKSIWLFVHIFNMPWRAFAKYLCAPRLLLRFLGLLFLFLVGDDMAIVGKHAAYDFSSHHYFLKGSITM